MGVTDTAFIGFVFFFDDLMSIFTVNCYVFCYYCLDVQLMLLHLLLLFLERLLGQSIFGTAHALRSIHVETENTALQLGGFMWHNAMYLLELCFRKPGGIRVLDHLNAAQTRIKHYLILVSDNTFRNFENKSRNRLANECFSNY